MQTLLEMAMGRAIVSKLVAQWPRWCGLAILQDRITITQLSTCYFYEVSWQIVKVYYQIKSGFFT